MMLLDAASARLLGLPPMGAFLASTCRSPQHGLARRAENSAEPLGAEVWWIH